MSTPPHRWATAGGLGAGLLLGARCALRDTRVQRLDVRVGDALRLAGSSALDRAVTYSTDLGSLYAVTGIAGVLTAARRGDVAADVISVGTLAWAISQAAKTRVRRQRPYEADGVRRLIRPPTGSSFPSGHAAVGMAVMEVLAGRSSRRAAAPVLRALGAYVAASRVYVGVHYPTDVIGGAGLGLVLGSVWRGPVARAGRGAVALSAGTVRRVAPVAGRVAHRVVFGPRPSGRVFSGPPPQRTGASGLPALA